MKPGRLVQTVDLDQIIRGIEQLLDEREVEVAHDPGARNFRCEDCNACYDCRFCMRCDGCSECTYCEDSVECTGCTQCRRSLGCEGCSYCEDSRDCTGSRYLTLCVECADCVHCLACVGLTGAEFHVLNRKLARREYFDLLKKVQAEIEARSTRGWRPEVIGLETVEEAPGASWEADGAEDEDEQASAWLDDSPVEDEPPEEPPLPRPRWSDAESESPWREDTPARRETVAPEPASESPSRREGLRRGRRPPRRS